MELRGLAARQFKDLKAVYELLVSTEPIPFTGLTLKGRHGKPLFLWNVWVQQKSVWLGVYARADQKKHKDAQSVSSSPGANCERGNVGQVLNELEATLVRVNFGFKDLLFDTHFNLNPDLNVVYALKRQGRTLTVSAGQSADYPLCLPR